MRRFLAPLAALLVALPLAACASSAEKPPVGLTSRSEINGAVRTTVALRIGDAPEVLIARVRAEGKGTLTVSTDAPHVVADGDLVVVEESTLPAGSVIVRSRASFGAAAVRAGEPPTSRPSPNPAAATAAPSCTSDWCPIEASPVPAASPACVAAPLPVAVSPLTARPCGTPVYVGCDGTVGGNRPTPGPTYKPMPPCDRPLGLTGPQKVAMAPVGLVACLVKGLVGTIECILAGPGL